MNSISKYFFKTTLIVLVGLMGSSCSPEYLRPTLPGRIPVVETLPNQNLVAANSQIQLRGRCYFGKESLIEVGFLVSPISGFVEYDQNVEKVLVSKSDLTLTSDGEYLFDMEFNVGLVSDLTKYYRAFCKNSLGIGYGDQASFTTFLPTCGTSTVSDVDNNVYNTVQIGTQCWTKSNLMVSKYRNGDNIPTGLSNSSWQNPISGAYSIYSNDPVNDGLYGKLYNHYAVKDSRGLCPIDWHVPTDAEWTSLEIQLGGSGVAGGALKSTTTNPPDWYSPNTGATNSSGFTALPGGLRNFNGDFDYKSNSGYWWSSSVSSESNAWFRNLNANYGSIDRGFANRAFGFSVRCLRD